MGKIHFDLPGHGTDNRIGFAEIGDLADEFQTVFSIIVQTVLLMDNTIQDLIGLAFMSSR